MHYRSLIIVLLLGVISACSTTPTGRKQLLLVSEAQAITSSKQAYTQTIDSVSEEGKLNTDPALTRRVRQITDRIIPQAVAMRPDTASWEWQINVIEDDQQVNAWCMAGGKMAVYTGLIKAIQPSDDELAQVIGHEISHALANHSAERMSIALASKMGIAVLGAVSDSQLTTTAGVAAAKLAVELPNSRTGETEADKIGIELAAKAGYDPRAAVTLWQKMGQLGGSTPQFLSTHPSPDNRQQTLEALIPNMMPYYQAAKGN
ncbi:M48 family peptidase [Ectothiorhodospiraceae bacterium BW-2]|nr:M48 family peptidase [Ectothiorhodospiraceae bacterium BW-2]